LHDNLRAFYEQTEQNQRANQWPPIYPQKNRSGQLTFYLDLRAVDADRPGFQLLNKPRPVLNWPDLPGNSLLYAIALMAAGWDGFGGRAPGFPDDGSWVVKWEGLNKAP
jgi:hypothetical protein